ncbi:hypothetical protein Pla175_43660 [Pirellulimonas nuda]|uniref:Uncharacterized protein n=1 Tax=Pirellulimonas nuda TaxID=2528009 RepID=A0A518DHR9_9BACT|nr:hypothetical protein Pla175_43660 [Pirellulimonas nuda]
MLHVLNRIYSKGTAWSLRWMPSSPNQSNPREAAPDERRYIHHAQGRDPRQEPRDEPIKLGAGRNSGALEPVPRGGMPALARVGRRIANLWPAEGGRSGGRPEAPTRARRRTRALVRQEGRQGGPTRLGARSALWAQVAGLARVDAPGNKSFTIRAGSYGAQSRRKARALRSTTDQSAGSNPPLPLRGVVIAMTRRGAPNDTVACVSPRYSATGERQPPPQAPPPTPAATPPAQGPLSRRRPPAPPCRS